MTAIKARFRAMFIKSPFLYLRIHAKPSVNFVFGLPKTLLQQRK
jgi:hypothetical protein